MPVLRAHAPACSAAEHLSAAVGAPPPRRLSSVCAPERMRAVGLILADLHYPEILMFQASRCWSNWTAPVARAAAPLGCRSRSSTQRGSQAWAAQRGGRECSCSSWALRASRRCPTCRPTGETCRAIWLSWFRHPLRGSPSGVHPPVPRPVWPAALVPALRAAWPAIGQHTQLQRHPSAQGGQMRLVWMMWQLTGS